MLKRRNFVCFTHFELFWKLSNYTLMNSYSKLGSKSRIVKTCLKIKFWDEFWISVILYKHWNWEAWFVLHILKCFASCQITRSWIVTINWVIREKKNLIKNPLKKFENLLSDKTYNKFSSLNLFQTLRWVILTKHPHKLCLGWQLPVDRIRIEISNNKRRGCCDFRPSSFYGIFGLFLARVLGKQGKPL